MDKFRVEIYRIILNDECSNPCSSVEILCFEKLQDLLQGLKAAHVPFKNINIYHRLSIDETLKKAEICYLNCFGQAIFVLANVTLHGKPLPFVLLNRHQISAKTRSFPNYTACGYKLHYRNKKKRRIKTNYRNVKHPMNSNKDANHRVVELSELMKDDLDINPSQIPKLFKKVETENVWDLCESVRSHRAGSWKLQKKRHQYDVYSS